MPPPPLLLASTSPYRRALLERLGLAFAVAPPRCDEEALKDPRLGPEEQAAALAQAKAASLIDLHPEHLIIGSDQLVALDQQVLGKPGGRDQALAQLLALAGRAHRLITALSVWHAGSWRHHLDIATLHMRPLSRDEAERYLDADQPFDCAGSYKLEQRGIALFEGIEAADHSAITGLPLLALCGILRDCAWPLP